MIPVVYTVPEWIPILGGQAITSFGVFLLAAFLVGGGLFVRTLRMTTPGLRGWDLVVVAAVGGLLGGKVLHVAVNVALGLPVGFGRSGLDWFGGLVGGAVALLWYARAQGLSPASVASAAAAPLALGYAVGKLGSFLVGSEYGIPTALPWGVSFPGGAPPTTPTNLEQVFGATVPEGAIRGDYVRVHPAQLYETVLSLGIFGALRAAGRREGWWLAGLFLVLHGIARGLVELLRAKDDRIVGVLTVDLLLAVAAVAVGAWLLTRVGDEAREETA